MITGITEDDIVNYLVNTPGFFERHAELLGTVRLTSPHGQRAVSLQERQMEMLRDKIKGLEQKIVEMIRHGQDNVAIADRLHRWTRTILLTPDPRELPVVLVQQLKHQFLIPQAALKLWSLDPALADEPFAQGVSEDVKTFTASLALPYCGPNAGFEAARWLDEGAQALSIAMVPLRCGPGDGSFGLLVLGSPDATRYTADMGTEFLVRVGEIASAGLARLVRP